MSAKEMFEQLRYKLKDYAIYDSNDALIFVGKFKKCVEYLGYTNHETLHDVISRTRRGLRKSGCRVYEIEEGDDDE